MVSQPQPGTSTRTPWAGATSPPRAWQAEALPRVLDSIRRRERPLVSAVMGSGKSRLIAELCWLALPRSTGRAIVGLVPSTHLVEQLAEDIADRCGPDVVGQFYGRKKQPDRPIVVACMDSLPKLRAALDRRVAFAFVDEAHRSEPPALRQEIEALGAPALVGCTATPYRSIKAETLSLFTEIAYRYEIAEGVRDGHLVPPRVVDWRGRLGEDLDLACCAMIAHETTGPGVVFCASISAAEYRAEMLTAAGIPALATHSKLTPREKVRRLAALKSGEIRALTQVGLLVEGVNMPWLMWLCIWDPIVASVKWLQGAGRVLRAHPGKTHGLILDPHLCFGRHGWTSVEAIGAALVEAAEAEERDRAAPVYEPSPEQAVALEALVRNLGETHAAMVFAGICETPRFSPGGWQIAGVSERQVAQLRKSSRLTRHIPREYRPGVSALVKVPWALTRGQASVLLDVLLGGARWAREEARRLEQSGSVEVEWFRLQWPAREIEVARPSSEDAAVIERWGARVKRIEERLAKREQEQERANGQR